MATARKRIIELITKVSGAPELKKTETALRRIDKQTALANKQLAIMNKNTNKVAQAMGNLVGVATVLVGARAFGGIIKATVEQEKALAQLNAVIASTGGIAGKTADDMTELAAQMQAVTTYGDDAVIGAESLLLTFKEIRGVNFDRTVKSILDVSTAMGQDLKSSTIQLGKALNDPVLGLSALTRVGITFTEGQKDLIKSMVAVGNISGAQVEILKELESQFEGSAVAARQTLGGALDALTNAFGDLLEADKGASDLTDSVNELADVFNSPQFKSDVQGVVNELLRLSSVGLSTMTNFTEIVGFLADEFKALYGVVGETDLVRLYERQAELQEKLNRTGFTGLIQNTTELSRQLAVVNAQIERAEKNAASLSRLQPIVVTAKRKEGLDIREAPVKAGKLSDLQNVDAAKVSKEYIALSEKIEKLNENREKTLEAEAQLYAKLYPEVIAYQESIFDLNEALRLGYITQEEFDRGIKQTEQTLADAQEGFSLASEGAKLFESSFDTMLDGVLMGTQDIKSGITDMVKVVLAQLAKLAAYQLFANAFGIPIGGVSPQAKGNVFSGGDVVPFASGGVVSSPTLFPMAKGTGLMGEAGPEMIAPIRRLPNGDMGVGASPVNVTVNNMAPGVSVNARQGENGLTIDVVMQQMSQAIRRGGNPVADAMEASYSLGRGRAVY